MHYGSARELFEAARAASLEADRLRRQLMRMEASEGATGGGLGAVHGPGISDPMARVDARIDRERAWARTIEEDHALMDEACAVLYGEDQRGGVAACIGTAYADLLWFRYLAHMTMADAARSAYLGRSTAYRMVPAAFAFIDANGIDATVAGVVLDGAPLP